MGATSTKPPTGRPSPNPWATKLDENRLFRQPRRQNRPRADQSPNPWATKLGKNRLLRQPCRQNRQRADHSPNPSSQLTCFKMKTVRCSARQCTPGRSHVLEGLTSKLNPKPVKVKMRVERQRGWDTQKQSERAMKGGACQPTNSPPLSRDHVWTP